MDLHRARAFGLVLARNSPFLSGLWNLTNRGSQHLLRHAFPPSQSLTAPCDTRMQSQCRIYLTGCFQKALPLL